MKLSKNLSSKFKKKTGHDLLPPIQGLSEREINIFYNLVPIKKLNPGDILINEGDVDQTAYIILNGKIKVQKNISGLVIELSILGKGDWVGEIALIRKIPRTATALAVELSTVMVIDSTILNMLEAKTQLHIFKHFNDLASKRINQLEAREKELSHKNVQLMADIYQKRTQHMTDLQDSELILEILKKIPKLPSFANTLISDMMNDQTSAAQVAEKTQKDPTLTGLVLKTINSSYYGFQKKISDIQHAITLLGFNQLYQLITSEGIRKTMPNKPEFKELHSHCVAISQISFTLSQTKHIGKPVQMATIGLLHDLGQVVIILLKRQNPKLANLIDALDRAHVGGLLLKSWSLPDAVWKSIEYQFYPEFVLPNNIPSGIRDNIAILYIAHLCYEYYQGKTEEQLSTTFLSEYKQFLKLEQYELSDIARYIVLPGLAKNINSLPATLRKLVQKQTETNG